MAQITTVLSATISESNDNPFRSSPEEFTFLLLVILFSFALAFYLLGFRFASNLLTKKKSTVTTGTLQAFQIDGHGTKLYFKNGPGMVPYFTFKIDGEVTSCVTMIPHRNLTGDDIGKRFRIRYRGNSFLMVICMEDEMLLRKHNLLVRIYLGISITLASIFLLPGILTWIYGLEWLKPLFPHFT